MSLYTKKTIKLEKLSFFGYHGVNDYEKIDGQNFKIDLEISFHLNTSDDDINKSIDYIDLYNCIKKRFNKTRFNLLETLAQRIIDDISNHFKNVYHIKINIRKPSISIDENIDFINVELEFNK